VCEVVSVPILTRPVDQRNLLRGAIADVSADKWSQKATGNV